jgi:hypothetical protein
MVDKVAVSLVSLQELGFPSASVILTILHIHLHLHVSVTRTTKERRRGTFQKSNCLSQIGEQWRGKLFDWVFEGIEIMAARLF